MIQNVNPQRMYVQPNGMPLMQDYQVQPSVPYAAPYPIVQPGVSPVYSSIPYSPVYGNYGQAQQCQHPPKFAPKISTVSIELNGLEPPKVPGYSDVLQQSQQSQQYPQYPQYYQSPPAPQYYPSAAQCTPVANQVPVYQPMQQAMPQYSEQRPYMPPVGMQPLPAAYPPAPQYIQPGQQAVVPAAAVDQKISAAPVQAYPPAPQYIQPGQQAAVPAAAVDQKISAAPVQANLQQDQESIKPLLESLNVIYPKPGDPEVTLEQQSKAIQTIAQFARAAEASGQLSKTDPNNPEVKQTKEKVDTLIKPNLIKEETFLGLADIAVKDTSALTGDNKKKADENRIISMWTLAMLQKVFKQEMNDEAQKIKIPPISMNEVPGITQVVGIVVGDKEKNILPDASPEVREAGIAALVNLADVKDPKDVETMRSVLTEAQADTAPNVKSAATEALKAYA